jgi:hypothetical protein
MAFSRKIDRAGDFITVGKDGVDDGGKPKPVRFKVRMLSPRERDDCQRAAYGKLKGRQLGRELASKLAARAEAETIERAIAQVLDSDNYTIRIIETDVELYSKELGRPVKAGDEICLDGVWTDALKRDVFEAIEGLAKAVDDRVSKLTRGEIEEDDEDTEDFS